jgi:hypothetical protein
MNDESGTFIILYLSHHQAINFYSFTSTGLPASQPEDSTRHTAQIDHGLLDQRQSESQGGWDPDQAIKVDIED